MKPNTTYDKKTQSKNTGHRSWNKTFWCFFSTGRAKLRVSLRDRRNSSDVFSMPGDFTTVDQSGSVQPLKTYGILRIKVQDQENNQLDLAGNLKLYVDANKVITTCGLLVYAIRKTYKRRSGPFNPYPRVNFNRSTPIWWQFLVFLTTWITNWTLSWLPSLLLFHI